MKKLGFGPFVTIPKSSVYFLVASLLVQSSGEPPTSTPAPQPA